MLSLSPSWSSDINPNVGRTDENCFISASDSDSEKVTLHLWIWETGQDLSVGFVWNVGAYLLKWIGLFILLSLLKSSVVGKYMSDKVTHFTEDVNYFISSKYNIQIYQLVNKTSHFFNKSTNSMWGGGSNYVKLFLKIVITLPPFAS